MRSFVIKLSTLFTGIALFCAGGFLGGVHAYAPNVSGSVYQNTGAPLSGVWVEWSSVEAGDDGNVDNKGTSYRYSGTNEQGKFMFKSWDSEGVAQRNGKVYSNVGLREHREKIDLDYNSTTGDEAVRTTTDLYDIFNCHNETNSFTIKVPPDLKDATVQARWKRDNSSEWTPWGNAKISLPKDIFSNSHDYEVEFQLTVPKVAAIRDIDSEITPATVQNLNSGVNKVPACVQTDLCTEENRQDCSSSYSPAEGKHRVVLSKIGNTGIGDARRKLTSNNKPIWLAECVQEGTPAAPSYTCTTGNSQLDIKVFGVDNAATLVNKYGYKARIYLSGGGLTTAEITDANKQDAYEWETTVDPNKLNGKQLSSVYLALYEDEGVAPPESGPANTQKQATLSAAEGCRLIIDPYGKVFDNYTMEPISNVQVKLLSKKADGTYVKTGTSQSTSNNGEYRFMVAAGTYSLQPVRSGYIFPTTDLGTNTPTFYTNVYNGGDIKVTNQPVLMNLGMAPVDKQQSIAYASSNPITIERYFVSYNAQKQQETIDGYVSHPLAQIAIYSLKSDSKNQFAKERSRKVATGEADKLGHFSIRVDMTSLQHDEILGEIEASKKQVSGVSVPQTRPAVLEMEALLSSLDGFATNSQGVVIPNAHVELRMLGSNVSVVTAQADENGHFTIASSDIPTVPYSMTFTKGDQHIGMSTNAFLTSNEKLAGKQNRYYASSSSTVLGDYDKSVPENTVSGMKVDDQHVAIQEMITPSSPGLVVLAVVLIVFMFLGTAIVSVYIVHESKRNHFRKKKK